MNMWGNIDEKPKHLVSTQHPLLTLNNAFTANNNFAQNLRIFQSTSAAESASANTTSLSSPPNIWNNPNIAALMGNMGITVKDEPIDDTRNDSGVASGSSPSMSPESDRTDMNGQSPSPSYSTNSSLPEQLQQQQQQQQQQNIANKMHSYDSYIQNYQNRMESTAHQVSQTATDERASSCSPRNGGSDGGLIEDIQTPKVNSHGKVKQYRCKQCRFVTYTKKDSWDHNKTHMKENKMLVCPMCPFATEFKHHLEYHINNHKGAKPFKCDKCDYCCVNKSMLTSHVKSHSAINPYQCAECSYDSKYMHSFKIHLRRYKHKPGVVLNPDGTPNLNPIIDVYGTRRGPRRKKPSSSSGGSNNKQSDRRPIETSPNRSSVLDNNNPEPLNPPPMQLSPLFNQLINPGMFPLPGMFPIFPPPDMHPEMFMQVQAMFKERMEQFAKEMQNPNPNTSEDEEDDGDEEDDDGALNLTNKRMSEDEDSTMTTAFANVEVVENKPPNSDQEVMMMDHHHTPEIKLEVADNDCTNNNDDLECVHCEIIFKDPILYNIHKGYHGYNNPFTCNMCGEPCQDKINFFLHIAKMAH